jgi:hypothetical protein
MTVIYTIFSGSTVVYIGKSDSFLNRLEKHLKYVRAALEGEHISTNRHKLYEFLVSSGKEISIVPAFSSEDGVLCSKIEGALIRFVAVKYGPDTIFNTSEKRGVFSQADCDCLKEMLESSLFCYSELESFVGRPIIDSAKRKTKIDKSILDKIRSAATEKYNELSK